MFVVNNKILPSIVLLMIIGCDSKTLFTAEQDKEDINTDVAMSEPLPSLSMQFRTNRNYSKNATPTLPIKTSKNPHQDQEIGELNHIHTQDNEVDITFISKLDLDEVYKISPEDEGLDNLIKLIESASSPNIKMAALDQLAGADAYIAIEATISALNDPNPEIALKALETIQFIGDESVVRHIEKLLIRSPSEKVRRAAKEAIDFLS